MNPIVLCPEKLTRLKARCFRVLAARKNVTESKGTFHEARPLEFDPQDPHGEGKKLISLKLSSDLSHIHCVRGPGFNSQHPLGHLPLTWKMPA